MVFLCESMGLKLILDWLLLKRTNFKYFKNKSTIGYTRILRIGNNLHREVIVQVLANIDAES